MKNLSRTLKERLNWINFKANFFFPVFINKKNNQIIFFQNYDVLKFDNLCKKISSKFFSLNLRTKNGDPEVLWLSFTKNGTICGDHSY